MSKTFYIELGWLDSRKVSADLHVVTDHCPCDQCSFVQQCAEQSMACPRFEAYVNGRPVDPNKKDWPASQKVFRRV